jgi:hypothetical protein
MPLFSSVGGFFRKAEIAGLCQLEKRTRSTGVSIGDEDLDGSQAIERQTVRMSQRFATLDDTNAGAFEKTSNLLSMHFTIGNEDALQLFRHDVIPILSMLALPCYSPQCRPGNMLRQRTMRAARQRQSEKRRGKGRPRRGCPGPTPSILNYHLEATFFRAVERFAKQQVSWREIWA